MVKGMTLRVHGLEVAERQAVVQLQAGLRGILSLALDSWRAVNKVTEFQGELSNRFGKCLKIALVLRSSCQAGGLMILTFGA